jgi:hypothetical protein
LGGGMRAAYYEHLGPAKDVLQVDGQVVVTLG